eukprot:9161140-Pyramimonas_sp.AAC.1
MRRSTVHQGCNCRLVRVHTVQPVPLRPSVARVANPASSGLFPQLLDWYAGARSASEAPPERGSDRCSSHASGRNAPARSVALTNGSSPKVTVSRNCPAANSLVPKEFAFSLTEVISPGPITACCSHASLNGRLPLLLSLRRKTSAFRSAGAAPGVVESAEVRPLPLTPKVALKYQ